MNTSERLEIESQIARLDREWMIYTQNMRSSFAGSGYSLPNHFSGAFLLIAGSAFLGFSAYFYLNIDAERGWYLFAIMGIIPFFTGLSEIGRANKYSNTKDRYEEQRKALLHKLEMSGTYHKKQSGLLQ
ncbi:MAG: hypothetical protein MK212_04455 [Saprospiraceae bacterium]|nr:hypothetical protein [Saprospiraceae bacterium]